MANNVVGSLIVNLGLETGRLNSDTKKASKHFNTFEKKASRALNRIKSRALTLSTQISKLGFIAGAVSAGGMLALSKSAINSADEIQKLSIKLGSSTEALSEYRHVAELSGVQFGTLTKGFQNMVDKISDASKGTGEAANSIKDLGLDAEKLNRLKPEQQFEAIADAMLGISNQGDKVRIAMDLFGGRGVGLIQAMEGGAAGIRAMRKEAEMLGITLSRDDADGAALANDNMTRLEATASALAVTMGRHLQGPIAQISDKLTKAALASGGFQKEIKTAVKVGIGSLATMVETTDGVIDYFNEREGLATAGIVGYMLFGKKGLAAVAAAQLVVDATANSIQAMNSAVNSTQSTIVDTGEIEAARSRLVFLTKQYNDEVERGLDGTRAGLRDLASGTLKMLNTQKMRVSGMELMIIGQQKLNKEQEQSDGLLSSIARSLRDAQKSMDDLTETGGKFKPEKKIADTIPLGIVAGEEEVKAQKKADATLQIKLDSLTVALMNEEQRLFDSYANRDFIIEDAFERGLINEQRYQELLEQNRLDHEKKLTDITKKGLSERSKFQALSTREQTSQVLGELVTLTAGVAQHNKALFRINKVAGIAQAIVNTHRGVSETLAAYPQPLAGILAAGHLAAGVAQVSAIKATSYGGGGGVGSIPSSAGTVTSSNDNQEAAAVTSNGSDVGDSTQIRIYIEGNIIGTEEGIRTIVVEAMEQAQANDEIRLVGNG